MSYGLGCVYQLVRIEPLGTSVRGKLYPGLRERRGGSVCSPSHEDNMVRKITKPKLAHAIILALWCVRQATRAYDLTHQRDGARK